MSYRLFLAPDGVMASALPDDGAIEVSCAKCYHFDAIDPVARWSGECRAHSQAEGPNRQIMHVSDDFGCKYFEEVAKEKSA